MNDIIDIGKLSSLMAVELNKATLSYIEKKPNSKILNLETLTLDDIKDYIKAKHCQIWARFSVADSKALEATADWFKGEINSLYEFICLNQGR